MAEHMAANTKPCRKQTKLSKAEWTGWEMESDEGGGGQWCCRKATLTGLTEQKFRRHFPENDRGATPTPLLQIIQQWTWLKQWSGTMETERNEEKRGWGMRLSFSSTLSLRATGPSERRRPDCSVFPSIHHCRAALWGYKLMRCTEKKKKKTWWETD